MDTLPLWFMTHLAMTAGEEEGEGKERGRGSGTGEEEEEEEEEGRGAVGLIRGTPCLLLLFPLSRLRLCLRTMKEEGGGREEGWGV